MWNKIKYSGNKAIVILLVVLTTKGFTQIQGDARSCAAGQITSFPGDYWAACNNPSNFPENKGFSLGLSLLDKYILKEMKYLNLTFHYDTPQYGIGVALSVDGFYTYLNQWYALSYGRKLTKRIRAGVSLVYNYIRTASDKPGLHTASFKLGFSFALSDNLRFSFQGLNPFSLSYSTYKGYSIPSIFNCGLVYMVYDHLLIAMEITSGSDVKLNLKGGLEYDFQQKFYLRAGMLSNPFRFTSGVGINHSRISIDIATEYHSFLGFSPVISLVYHPSLASNDPK